MACWCPGAHAGKAALLVVPPPRHTPPSNSALTLVGPGFFQVHPWLPQPRLFRLFCAANRVLLPGSAPGSLVFCTQRPPHGQRNASAWEPARCCVSSEAPLPSSLTFPLLRRHPWVQEPSLLQSSLPGAQARSDSFLFFLLLSYLVTRWFSCLFGSLRSCRHSAAVPCEWFSL